MKGLKGNKQRGVHTTAIGLVEKIYSEIKKSPHFSSIRFGQIKIGGRANGERRVKLTEVSTGFDLQVKEGRAIQHISIYSKNPAYLKADLQVIFDDAHILTKS